VCQVKKLASLDQREGVIAEKSVQHKAGLASTIIVPPRKVDRKGGNKEGNSCDPIAGTLWIAMLTNLAYPGEK